MQADPRASERGFSLIEVMVALGLLSVVSAICGLFLVTAQTAEGRTELQTNAEDQVRLAIQQLDQQVRSGNLIYDPSLESPGTAGPNCAPADGCVAPGYSVRVYTQANGANKCVQWRVYQASLQSRSWSEDESEVTNLTHWQTVATKVWNADVSPTVTPFALDGTPSYGDRVLDVNIMVNEGQGYIGQVQSSITGRNTEYGYPVSVCSTVPPWQSS